MSANKSALVSIGCTLLSVFCLIAIATTKSVGRPATKEVSDVVRTKRFELVDDNGKVRAEIKVRDGITILGLQDKNEVPHLVVAIPENGDTSFAIMNPAAPTGIVLSTANIPVIRMLGKVKGKEREKKISID